MAVLPQKNNEVNYSHEDTIILNVGGIKYETYPSTLTAFPDTLLGTMFSERNKSMLHPKNGNEYFIDRNGYAFRYILEFYRNGKILWKDDPEKNNNNNITREELEQEIDYFQIPAKDCTKPSGERTVSAKIDIFITALKELINVAMDQLQTEVHLTFFEDGSSGVQYWLPASRQCGMIFEIIRPFDMVGFIILSQFGEVIKRYLKSEIPEITCKLSDKPPRLPPIVVSPSFATAYAPFTTGILGSTNNINNNIRSSFCAPMNSRLNRGTLHPNNNTTALFGGLLGSRSINNMNSHSSALRNTAITAPNFMFNNLGSQTSANFFGIANNQTGVTTGFGASGIGQSNTGFMGVGFGNAQSLQNSNNFGNLQAPMLSGTLAGIQQSNNANGPQGTGTFNFTNNNTTCFGFNAQNTPFPFTSQPGIQSASSSGVTDSGATVSTSGSSSSISYPGEYVFRRHRNHDSKSLELIIMIDYDYTVEQILRNTVLTNV